MKVMVVIEDSAEMAIIIQRVLARDDRLTFEGTADTAEKAVIVAGETQPDLVILDHFIHGPVLGLEAAPLIKRVAPSTKILLFSDFDLAAEAAKEPAIDLFLPKKRLSELLTTVQTLLGLAQA
jgi:DNA-binding NarL/FixJ family response regulator